MQRALSKHQTAQMASSKVRQVTQKDGLGALALLQLVLLEGDKEGCAKTPVDPDGNKSEGPVDDSDHEQPEAGAPCSNWAC